MGRHSLRAGTRAVLAIAILCNAGCGPARSSTAGSDVKFSGDVAGETSLVAGSTGFQGARGTIGTQHCRAYPAGEGYADTTNYPRAPANYQADLRAVLASEVYYLSIWVLPFGDSGTFPIATADHPFGAPPSAAIVSLSDYGEFNSPMSSSIRGWSALSGTVTVNRDRKSGSLDARFGSTGNGVRAAMPVLGPPSLTIAGTWSCQT
jgi:hypothetical protein